MGRANTQKMSESTICEVGWKRKRPERIDQSPYNLPNVDVHGILFAVVVFTFVVYPVAQWALGR